MKRSEIRESASRLSVPPYFAALHTGYVQRLLLASCRILGQKRLGVPFVA
jgi:hypothetical protein